MLASRTVLRLQRSQLTATARSFSASSAGDYHSLDDQIFYTPQHELNWSGDKMTVFNGQTSEKMYAPWELKEIAFKNFMGFSGLIVLDHINNHWLGAICPAGCAFWVLNATYRSF